MKIGPLLLENNIKRNVVYSRYWMRQHGWSSSRMRSADHITETPTLLPAFTGCASRSGSITRSLCWRIKFYTEVRRGIWGHSFLLSICPADGHYALVAPVVWWCHLSDVQQSLTGRLRLLGPRVWNTLPEEITTSQTLSTFRQQLKTWLFRKSYLDIIIWTSSL